MPYNSIVKKNAHSTCVKVGAFLFAMINKRKIKVWVDVPTRYKDRKSSSGLAFGGKYIEVDEKNVKKGGDHNGVQ